MDVDDIEQKVARGELTAMQVFTLMNQFIPKPPKFGIYHCTSHGGYGFVSDCCVCAQEFSEKER